MKCQSYSKKNKPCKNYAMKNSYLCYAHKKYYKDFPPVKITALICPYCGESIKKWATFCSFCDHSFLICEYCDEPLRISAKTCTFCEANLTPVKPTLKDRMNNHNVTETNNGSAARGMGLDAGFLITVILALWLTAIFYLISQFYE